MAFGTSYFWLEQLLQKKGSLSQSVALEDFSSSKPESLSYAKEKRLYPALWVVLKKSVLDKPDTFVGSIDYFTKVRKPVGENKIMLFPSYVGFTVEKETAIDKALKAIENNNGVISEEIEKNVRHI